MDDLISRKSLLDFIKEEIKQDRPDDFKIRNIQRYIEDIPTAYNVDKVIKQIKEQPYKEEDVFGVPNRVECPPMNGANYESGYNACIDEILGGGE